MPVHILGTGVACHHTDLVRVSRDGTATIEFWFRKTFPLIDDAAAGLGVSYGKILPGMLLGVATAAKPRTDYRKGTLPAGTYALRYAIQPSDSNHMGVSLYRDFLIALAFEDDPGPDELMDVRPLTQAGNKVTGTNHAAVIALFHVYDEAGETPALRQNELDHWMAVTEAGELIIALVIEGFERAEGN